MGRWTSLLNLPAPCNCQSSTPSRPSFQTCAPGVISAAPPSYSTAQDYLVSVHLAFKAFVPTGSLGLPGYCSKARREPIFFSWAPWAGTSLSTALLLLLVEGRAGRTPSTRPLSATSSAGMALLLCRHGPAVRSHQGSSCGHHSWSHLYPISLDLLAAVHAVGHPFLLTRLLGLPRQENVLLPLWLPLLGLC